MLKLLRAALLLPLFIATLHAQYTIGTRSGFFGTSGGGSITYVTGCTYYSGGSVVSSAGCAVSGLSAGDTIIVHNDAGPGNYFDSVTDSGGTPSVNVGANWTGYHDAYSWIFNNVSAGSHTLTGNYHTAQNAGNITVDVFRGVSVTNPVAYAVQPSAFGCTSGGNVVAAQAGQMVVAGATFSSSITSGAAGWSALNGILVYTMYKLSTGAQDITPTYVGGGGNCDITTMVLNPAGVNYTLPTVQTRWLAYNGSNVCYNGVFCANSLEPSSIADSVGSNTVNWPSTHGGGTFETGGMPNGQPSVFMGGGLNRYDIGTPITPTQLNSTTTWLVVFKMDAGIPSGTGVPLFGLYSGGGALSLTQDGSAGVLCVDKSAIANIGCTTSTYAAGTWHALLFTYNQPTGAWAFYNCHGGTCTADGSGVNSQTFTASTNEIGVSYPSGGSSGVFHFAEISWQNTLSTTGYGAYVLNKYGL